MIDSLVHRTEVISFRGDSYRMCGGRPRPASRRQHRRVDNIN
ncbi:hypothetical protein [Streptomyces sp. R08]|uniref:Uncharacterized protein n=1 Tax=Streptomyces sp. R08 TaxID=3238624 RepID=A0AB39MP60_9ACTN